MWFLGFFFAVKNCWFKLETSGDVPVGRRSHSAGELSMFQSSVLDIREVKHCVYRKRQTSTCCLPSAILKWTISSLASCKLIRSVDTQ